MKEDQENQKPEASGELNTPTGLGSDFIYIYW